MNITKVYDKFSVYPENDKLNYSSSIELPFSFIDEVEKNGKREWEMERFSEIESEWEK